MGFNQYFTSLALMVIFVIALLNFGVGFANDNDTIINLENSDFVGGLADDAATEANLGFSTWNSSAEGFEDSSIAEESQSGTLVTGGVFKDAEKSNKRIVFNVIRNAQAAIFGEDSGFGVIFTVIITLVGTISVLLIWKTWKGGNPD